MPIPQPERPQDRPTTRTLILGGPKTGKTTVARINAHQHAPVWHTDDLIQTRTMQAQAAAVAEWLDRPGPWVIEGVTGVRALRHWHQAHPGSPPPVDRVIFLTRPLVPRSPSQESMARGVATVWAEITPWLRDAGLV